MASYSKLLRKAIGNGARSNKFNVVFNFKDSNNFEKKLAITCKSCDYPSIKTNSFDFKYRGRAIPIPLSSNFDHDWTAEFYLDESHLIREFFDEWMLIYHSRGEYSSMTGENFKKKINLSDGSIFSSFDDDFFTVSVDIYQFPFETNILPETIEGATAHYKLYNVFPTDVQKLSAGDADGIMTVKVSFKYSYFERIHDTGVK